MSAANKPADFYNTDNDYLRERLAQIAEMLPKLQGKAFYEQLQAHRRLTAELLSHPSRPYAAAERKRWTQGRWSACVPPITPEKPR